MSATFNVVIDALKENKGWLPFDRFVDIALHHPQHGYYGSGKVQFGLKGDFVTAPIICPLFGVVLSQMLTPILLECDGDWLELGGGDGTLAQQILNHWQENFPTTSKKNYFILETSSALKAIQKKKLIAFDNVIWLEELPQKHIGIIFANEVLDCLPFRIFNYQNAQWLERGVSQHETQLIWKDQKIDDAITQRLPHSDSYENYQTEISPQAEALTATLVECLQHGYLLMADYGYSRKEYYHPQRSSGTMMCHYQQLADSNPFEKLGEKDITTHIDFTAIADSGIEAKGKLVGYTTQSHFLINAGITDCLSQYKIESKEYIQLCAGVHKLLAIHEMGELFKWIGFSKAQSELSSISGFRDGDKCHLL